MSRDLDFRHPIKVVMGGIPSVNGKTGAITITGDRGIVVDNSGSDIVIKAYNVLRDSLGNRPAAADAPETIFFDTTNNLFYFSDGSSWFAELIDLNNGTTGTLNLSRGGTGATTALAARENLDTYSKAEIIAFSVAL